MSMHKCVLCGSFIFDWKAPHECTEFTIAYDGEEDEFWVENPEYLMKKGRYTPTHEAAAEAWAKWYNEDGDYALMNESVEITVERNGDIRRFRVGAEPSIDYTVERVEVDDEEV